jgi:hypothetical protein
MLTRNRTALVNAVLPYLKSRSSRSYACLVHRTAVHTCANASSRSQPTNVRVDDIYADCYRSHHGKEVDRSVVLPVLKALQEHPAASALWEKCIPSVINLANAQTTQLAWILHCRLVRRMMGHHGPRTFRSPIAVSYRILIWD